jgi:hypothetical protein
MILSRREWHRLVCAGFISGASTPSAQPDKGVLLGVQSYSFRDRSLDAALTAMQQLGLTSCELWQGHVEPRDVARGEMRRWRETVPLASFRDIKSKFDRARIAVSAYNISFKDDFSDTEIARGFEMAEALGTHTITASANIAVIQRVAPVAARRRVTVAVHNHSRIDPKEFATPDHFTSAMKTSPFIAVNLDIGHFTAANFDAVDFLRAHHDRIVSNTSRTVGETMGRMCRSAKATLRSARRCDCCATSVGRFQPTSSTNTKVATPWRRSGDVSHFAVSSWSPNPRITLWTVACGR